MSIRVDELTRRDLLSDTDTVTKRRASKLQRARYRGTDGSYTVTMEVPSSTGEGYSYDVRIQMVEYPSLIDEEDLSTTEKVRLAMDGDLRISCTCPAFLYWGFKYITTQLDSNSSDPEDRFPKIRNPRLIGVMCKHCYRAIRGFGTYWSAIAKDIDRVSRGESPIDRRQRTPRRDIIDDTTDDTEGTPVSQEELLRDTEGTWDTVPDQVDRRR